MKHQPETPLLPTLLTPEELAACLQVAPSTIRFWAREGLIPGYRIRSKILRFDYGEVLNQLRRQREEAGRELGEGLVDAHPPVSKVPETSSRSEGGVR